MSREEEYKQKCRQVKDYYLEEICEHEDAGLRRVRVPALDDARLLPEPERYTEGRGYLAIKGKD